MHMEITSLENSRIKELVKLKEQKKTRYNEKKFLLEGARLSIDAYESGAEICSLYYTKEATIRYSEVIAKLSSKASEKIQLTEEVFKKVSDTKTPQGILLVCEMLDKPKIDGKMKKNQPWLVLEKISDPGNMGTIFRSADALGANLLLVGETVDPYSPKVVRSAMGALFHVPFLMMATADEALFFLKEKKIFSYAAVPNEKRALLLSKTSFSGNEAVWIGNEGHGLDLKTIELCDALLTIDMCGCAESLNAATAASIILWELSKSL